MEASYPKVGAGGNLLGVRFGSGPDDDITPDADGIVRPGVGGMSVSPSAESLPPHRLPRRLGRAYPSRFPSASGSNNLRCWFMGEGEFIPAQIAEKLTLRPDLQNPERHGFVEPRDIMQANDYAAALAATRNTWQNWEE